jgi:hypothetical protein
MLSSYADESWASNFFLTPIILAHIRFDQPLEWFYELLSKLNNTYGKIEHKAYKALEILESLPEYEKRKVWKTLAKTIIVVQDPRLVVRESGIIFMEDGSIKYKYEGKQYVIQRGNADYNVFFKLIIEYLNKHFFVLSPISNINTYLGLLSMSRPSIKLITPDNISETFSKADRKSIINTLKITVRMASAFFEVIENNQLNDITNFINENKEVIFNILPAYVVNNLKNIISYSRYFDKGHTMSVEAIKKVFNIINNSLTYDLEEGFKVGRVEELDSKESYHIQACDWAAGIARRIYEKEGIEGLKSKFDFVVFNGKIIK